MLEYARHGRSIGGEGSPLSPILSNIMLDDRDRKSSIRRAAEVTLLGFAFLLTGLRVRIRVGPKAIKRLNLSAGILALRPLWFPPASCE
jgi:NhaP-type Na+/H+ or K+/H+ antiporter